MQHLRESKFLFQPIVWQRFLRQIHRTTEERSLEKTSKTIDEADVKHHSNLADTWWQVNGPVAPLHALNKLRVPFIRDGLIATSRRSNLNAAKSLENLQILEVGCGAGILTEQLARTKANIVGIDPSETLINVARDHLKTYPTDNDFTKYITYSAETIEAHVDRSPSYDAVIVSEVLEHVNDKVGFLKSCTDVLTPGGSIFVTTFSRTNIAWFAGIIIAEYVLNLIPRGTHQYEKFISSQDTQRILEQYGCSTVVCQGFRLKLLQKQWKWTKHQQFAYALHAVKA